MTGAYRAVSRPVDAAHRHPVLVFDRGGGLHVPLTVTAKEAAERTSGKTAQTYLNAVRAGNRWDAAPEQVRQAVGDYLSQRLRAGSVHTSMVFRWSK